MLVDVLRGRTGGALAPPRVPLAWPYKESPATAASLADRQARTAMQRTHGFVAMAIGRGHTVNSSL
jgi:hypothetical protein